MHRQDILNQLMNYRTTYNTEAGFVTRMIRFVEENERCFESSEYPAHFTGSAWVVNPTRDKVLLLHHRKHDKWLQPGGHADGDADILRVAIRETHEESGLPYDAIHLAMDNIFDIDIHGIPPVGEKPQHVHYDVRYLLEIDDALGAPGSDESHEVRWIPLDDVPRYNNSLSTYRMVEKTRRLRNHIYA